jgi:ferredoxin
MLPDLWRISRQDGKATLIKSILKKDTYLLTISENLKQINAAIAVACPVKIIKVI